MKIVIDISEDVYTRLFDNGIQDNEIAVDDVCEMARAIRLGTPQKKPEKLLPCTCGSNRRYLWMNTIPGEPTWFYTCGGCAKTVCGKNKADLRRQWNAAIRNEVEDA